MDSYWFHLPNSTRQFKLGMPSRGISVKQAREIKCLEKDVKGDKWRWMQRILQCPEAIIMNRRRSTYNASARSRDTQEWNAMLGESKTREEEKAVRILDRCSSFIGFIAVFHVPPLMMRTRVYVKRRSGAGEREEEEKNDAASYRITTWITDRFLFVRGLFLRRVSLAPIKI